MTADAWTAYWKEGGTACLPGAPPAVQQALATHWQRAAQNLPPKARVLDLATGAGAVLAAIRTRRRDLDLTGVDQARLAGAPAGCRLLSGVDAAALPFDNGHFHLITSQFGIEYCPPRAMAEAMRVLAPDGTIDWLLHSTESPATRHNAARLTAMRALADAGLFRLARQAAAGFEDRALAARVHAARAAHAAQGIATELPAALTQALASAKPAPAIAAIEAKAASEMARLSAMGAAALSPDGANAHIAHLQTLGLAARLTPLAVGKEGRIAWHITGRRDPATR